MKSSKRGVEAHETKLEDYCQVSSVIEVSAIIKLEKMVVALWFRAGVAQVDNDKPW